MVMEFVSGLNSGIDLFFFGSPVALDAAIAGAAHCRAARGVFYGVICDASDAILGVKSLARFF